MTGLTALYDIIKFCESVAPHLARILGGSYLDIGITILRLIFNCGSNSSYSDILEKIKNDPDAETKIKQAELDNERTFQILQSQVISSDNEDKTNARAREISLRDHVPFIIAIVFFVGYIVLQFYSILHNHSFDSFISSNAQPILIMIMSYYFGSSHTEFTRARNNKFN